MGVEYLKPSALVGGSEAEHHRRRCRYALKILKPCSVCRHRYALCRQFEDTTGHWRCGMSLLLSGDLRLAQTYTLPDDADAVAYIAAVEAADGQALETATRMAINSFVKGCKADGIWPAIKASCILAGARTLTGALIPLVGSAPTNNGFIGIGTDYVRKTGLVGNGSTKYLDSNRANNADPQNSNHNACWVSTPAVGVLMASSSSNIGQNYMDTNDLQAQDFKAGMPYQLYCFCHCSGWALWSQPKHKCSDSLSGVHKGMVHRQPHPKSLKVEMCFCILDLMTVRVFQAGVPPA
jgi:hypothetical protein